MADHSNAPSWQPNRPLAQDAAAEIIAACFPDIDATALQYLGSGWEFDAFLTSDGWVFRFPRRTESERLFDVEARVHGLVGPALLAHVAIPRVEHMGPPTLGFPYRFAAHRFIPGIPVDAVAARLLPVVARQIGALLGALHSIPEPRARAAGIHEMDANDEGRQEWLRHGINAAKQLQGLDPTVDQALIWLREASLPTGSWNGPLQLIHHDLSTEHVLVNAATGALSGVLDWTDAILGDAARDFVFLATWRGWPFVEQVLENYPRVVDREFRARVRSMAQLLSTLWLAFAHEQGGDLTPHIKSVRNVFTSVVAS